MNVFNYLWYTTILYYFTFHILKTKINWSVIHITFFIQNDFSNKLTINIWTIIYLSIFIFGTLLYISSFIDRNSSYFSRMNNSGKFVNHVKILKKASIVQLHWNLTQLEFELEISHDLLFFIRCGEAISSIAESSKEPKQIERGKVEARAKLNLAV